MKILVLGAGKMGYAIAFDLIRSPRIEQVIVADNCQDQLDRLLLVWLMISCARLRSI